MVHFKKELDTTELIKWIVAAVGAVILFVSIQYKEFELKVAKINKEALEEIASYRPKARINYTNQLSENNKLLHVRVFFMPTSKYEVDVFPPTIQLFDIDNVLVPVNMYKAPDIGQFQGSFSPMISHQITYNIDISRVDVLKLSHIKLKYEIQTNDLDAYPLKYYSTVLSDVSGMSGSALVLPDYIKNITSKIFTYSERIYQHNENPIWSDFWEKPR